MSQTETRNPDEIEREIRQTQANMSDTVNKIGDQLTPRNLFNSLLDKADESGVDARYLLDGARRNPLALALISAGAIWLVSDYDAKPSAFASDDTGGKRSADDYGTGHRDYLDHMSRFERGADEDDSMYQSRRDEHRGMYLMIERDHDEDHQSYRQRLNEATDGMRQGFGNLATGARKKTDQAVAMGQRWGEKGQQAYHANPLLGGLAAALVGAVVGSAAPVSRMEREQLGQQGAKALDIAGTKAREIGQQARDTKDELVEEADRRMTETGTQGTMNA